MFWVFLHYFFHNIRLLRRSTASVVQTFTAARDSFSRRFFCRRPRCKWTGFFFSLTVMKLGFYGNAKESLEGSTPTKTRQSETSRRTKATSSTSSRPNCRLWEDQMFQSAFSSTRALTLRAPEGPTDTGCLFSPFF